MEHDLLEIVTAVEATIGLALLLLLTAARKPKDPKRREAKMSTEYFGLYVTATPPAPTLTGTELVPVAIAGVTNHTTTAAIAALNPASVISITVTVPSWLTVTPATITTTGTFAITAATGQPQNEVLATPNGSAGPLAVRALVPADLPSQLQTQAAAGLTGTHSFTFTTSPTGYNGFGEVGVFLQVTALSGTVTLTLSYVNAGGATQTATLFPAGTTVAAISGVSEPVYPNLTLSIGTATNVTVTATLTGTGAYNFGVTLKNAA